MCYTGRSRKARPLWTRFLQRHGEDRASRLCRKNKCVRQKFSEPPFFHKNGDSFNTMKSVGCGHVRTQLVGLSTCWMPIPQVHDRAQTCGGTTTGAEARATQTKPARGKRAGRSETSARESEKEITNHGQCTGIRSTLNTPPACHCAPALR